MRTTSIILLPTITENRSDINKTVRQGFKQKFLLPTFGEVFHCTGCFRMTETKFELLLLKPPFAYSIFEQTQIFVSNIRFVFARQSNIVFGCPNICSKDTERMFSPLGLLLTQRRLPMTGENINIQLFLRDNLHVGRIT